MCAWPPFFFFFRLDAAVILRMGTPYEKRSRPKRARKRVGLPPAAGQQPPPAAGQQLPPAAGQQLPPAAGQQLPPRLPDGTTQPETSIFSVKRPAPLPAVSAVTKPVPARAAAVFFGPMAAKLKSASLIIFTKAVATPYITHNSASGWTRGGCLVLRLQRSNPVLQLRNSSQFLSQFGDLGLQFEALRLAARQGTLQFFHLVRAGAAIGPRSHLARHSSTVDRVLCSTTG